MMRKASFALAAAGLTFCVTRVGAQMADLPQRGVYPNGAYTFDKLESINKYKGILTYSIPITSLPLGRGGMTVPVNLVAALDRCLFQKVVGDQSKSLGVGRNALRETFKSGGCEVRDQAFFVHSEPGLAVFVRLG